MGRWTARLRQPEEIRESAQERTDKTDETPTEVGSVSFVSDPSKRFRVFFLAPDRSEWDGEDWQTAYEERAAVLEYDAGMPRGDAELLAREQIIEMISDQT